MSANHTKSISNGNQRSVLVTNEDIFESHTFPDFDCLGDYLRWRFLLNHGLYILDLNNIKKVVNTREYCLQFNGVIGVGLVEQRPWGESDKEYVQRIGAPRQIKLHPFDDTSLKFKRSTDGEKTGNEVQREDPKDI